ncbi:MAG: AhpC/TSA family protein [Bacteroidales bacterium]|nr:AhpC/TSA family protein [Bacteroidales bacterium]
MKTKLLLSVALSLMIGFSGCHSNQKQSDYCTVKGTVKGLPDGTKLELLDAFNHWEVVGTGTVKKGAFEIHPDVSSPTHAYLYVEEGMQLKDFILEPGTILVEVDANDEEDLETGAKGTPSNEIDYKYYALSQSGNQEAAQAIKDSVLNAEQTGALALAKVEYWCKSSAQALGVLDRLSPELAALPYIDELRKELTQRIKTEPRTEGSDIVPLYIEMEYPDVNGKPVSLSSVVNDPNNRYVLVDFWATWCTGCVEAMPQLIEIYTKYHEKGLEIYGLSVNSDRKLWGSFVEERQLAWVNVCDGTGGSKEDSKVRQDYALRGYPTTLLIDCQSGEIIARGELEEMDAMLAELLK